MAIKISQGLRDAMLVTGSFKATMDGGYLHIFGGTPPTSPNDDVNANATLLATIYSDGGTANAGLNFAAATSGPGIVPKASGETWDNSEDGNIASGTATFYVFTADGEANGASLGASTSAARFMGSVAQAAADLNLTDPALSAGVPLTINSFAVALPENC